MHFSQNDDSFDEKSTPSNECSYGNLSKANM